MTLIRFSKALVTRGGPETLFLDGNILVLPEFALRNYFGHFLSASKAPVLRVHHHGLDFKFTVIGPTLLKLQTP